MGCGQKGERKKKKSLNRDRETLYKEFVAQSQGPHLAKRWEPRGFSRVAAAFSSYDGDLSLPLASF